MIKRLPIDRQTLVRFIKFFLVGGTGYGVSLLTFSLVKGVLKPNNAFTAAFVLSTAAHYLLNRFWALRSTRSDSWRQFAEYLFTVGLSYSISFGCFKLFSVYVGLGLGLAQALSIPPSTIVVFFILHFWVFRVHKHEPNLGNV
jgi:putative flippase GtrA